MNKLVRIGECKTCGKCCQQVVFSFKISAMDADFLRWVELHNIEVLIQPDTDKGEFHIKQVCRHLTEDNTCGIYKTRPEICREFPSKPEHCQNCPGFNFAELKGMS